VKVAQRLRAAWAILRGKQPRRYRGAAFPGADIGRLSSSWTTDSGAINRWLRYELRTLRARSRMLCRGDSYAKKFIDSAVNNVAGAKPFQLQCKVKFREGRLNDTANTAIEMQWLERCRPGNVEVTGRLSMAEVHRLLIRSIARDGEALVRIYRGGQWGARPKLQLIDIDRLDEDRNANLSDGGAIKMGVELDRYSKPVAYHILKSHPGEMGEWNRGQARDSERVPATDIRHLYISDWPEQARGIPWIHAAMVRLYHLGGFEEAAVINARVGASKIATLETPDGDVPDSLATGAETSGNLLSDIEPGQYWTLPAGTTLGSFNPAFPDASVEPFIRACLRGVAAGLGVAYHSLANDPAQVNYSTARVALLEERDMWMRVQEWYIEHWCTPDFEEFLKGEVLAGALPVAYAQLYNDVRWQPKRWSWVDPEKDAAGKELMLKNGLTSRTRISAELGEDFEEILRERKADEDMAEALGIELTETEEPAPTGDQSSGQPAEQEEPADAGSTAD
jgi:lambda family phage portal protein